MELETILKNHNQKIFEKLQRLVACTQNNSEVCRRWTRRDEKRRTVANPHPRVKLKIHGKVRNVYLQNLVYAYSRNEEYGETKNIFNFCNTTGCMNIHHLYAGKRMCIRVTKDREATNETESNSDNISDTSSCYSFTSCNNSPRLLEDSED